MVDIDITGQYQINGVPLSGSSNPSLVSISVSDGTPVTGTLAETVSQALLIPANTFTGNGMLEFISRFQKTGTAGASFIRIYKNTSASLTGATLVALFLSANSSTLVQGIRTARINSNTLTIWPTSTAVLNDYGTNGNLPTSTVFNTAVDNYILFCVQLVTATDSVVVEMARVVKYLEV